MTRFKYKVGTTVFLPDANSLVGTPCDPDHMSLLAQRLLGLSATVVDVDGSTNPPTYTLTFTVKLRENEIQSGQEHAIHRHIAENIRKALCGPTPKLNRKLAVKLINS